MCKFIYISNVELRLLKQIFINSHFDKPSIFDKWVLFYMEIWKDIPNYKGYYQVSNLGNVRSLDRFIISKNGIKRFIKGINLKCSLDNNGYLNCGLGKNGFLKTFLVHHLVFLTFKNSSKYGRKLVIDHINNIKSDNRIENLQLITQRKNASKDRIGYTSKYIGVSWAKARNRWLSCICVNGKTKTIGYFKDEKKARDAYLKTLESLKWNTR